jgi:hypothetical protein
VKGRGIAAVGIVMGLAGAAGLSVIALGDGNEPSPLAMGTAFFTFLMAAPFVIALLAFRTRSPAIGGGIWVGAGIVAIVLTVVTFSLTATLLVPPGGIVLIIAGAMAHAGLDTRRFVAAIVAIVAVGAIAAGASFVMRDSHCWYRAGDVWVERPYSNRISLGSARGAEGTRFSEGTCGSAPTTAAYGIGLGAWALAGAATLVVGRGARRPEPAPA